MFLHILETDGGISVFIPIKMVDLKKKLLYIFINFLENINNISVKMIFIDKEQQFDNIKPLIIRNVKTKSKKMIIRGNNKSMRLKSNF